MRDGWQLAWGVAAVIVTVLHSPPSPAQETIDPEEMADRSSTVAIFEFSPEIGEGWRQRTTTVVVLSWEAAGVESTIVDSTVREVSWWVAAVTDTGFIVNWTYGAELHFIDGRPIVNVLAGALEGSRYALLVDFSGEAVAELDPRRHTDAAEPETSLVNSPPSIFWLPNAALADWNRRVARFANQEWGQGESVFEIEELPLPRVLPERIFAELWLEEISLVEDRATARIECRYFTSANDTIPVDTEGFEEFLDETGFEHVSPPPLTDIVVAGSGTWYMDPSRLVIFEGESEIRGLVQRWPGTPGDAAMTSRFVLRRVQRAEPLAP